VSDLYVEQAGEGSPVVLVHAGICDSRMWDPQWSSFTGSHRTIRYDMRGFGRSPLSPGTFSHGRDLVELLDDLGLAQVALVGNSMGGRTVLEVAVAHPERVERLVLVDPGLPGVAWSDETRAGWTEEEAAFERGDLEAAADTSVRMWVHRPEVVERVREMQVKAYENDLAVGDAAEEELFVPDVAERAAEVSAPTLVLTGDEDRPEMLTLADRLAETIPDARRGSIPDAGHLPSLENPDAFDSLVLEFLA
jgi:pimeloyl-ACP methyl ester carboxylesterase